ncbi:MAG: hypothetical protein BRC45_11825 [Cyanobacteria bacterium QS_5_48_63]|nr:MAG: hypothetical protein BRC45_11825 [Cyanobacteria bacterium QS_5_48_63]
MTRQLSAPISRVGVQRGGSDRRKRSQEAMGRSKGGFSNLDGADKLLAELVADPIFHQFCT